MFLILSSSCWFSLKSTPDASACRTTTNSSALFPGFHRHSPAPRSTRALFLSLTCSVSAILSLYAFILAFHVKVLSMIVLILSLHSSLCGFVAFPCDASAAHPGQTPCVRELLCPQTTRRIFCFQLLVLFQPQSLAMVVRSFCVSCDFLGQLQFWSHHLPRSASQTFPLLQCHIEVRLGLCNF